MADRPPLYHYSHEPLGTLFDRRDEIRDPDWKPRGLWVSTDDEEGWDAWARQTWGDDGRDGACTRVHLDPAANVLWIADAAALAAFDRVFGEELLPGESYTRLIRWRTVADRWQGVVIVPYQRAMRWEILWYYGWDCASGCIWDPAAIARLEPLEQATSEPERTDR